MFEFLYQTDLLLSFVLVFFRVTGIIFSAPMFSSQLIPSNVRILVALVLSIVVYSTIEPIGLTNASPLLLILLILKEVLLGVVTGMMAQLLFTGVQIAGEIAGFQMGFSMVNSFDPSMNMQLSIISQYKNIAMLLFFVALGGHLLVIGAMAQSFKLVPLGVFVFEPEGFLYIVKMLSASFRTALQIVAPIFVTMLCTHMVMGILGRLVPQLNLMIVGFPLQIGVGLTILSLTLNYFYIAFEKLLHEYFMRIATLFQLFGGN
jgi:flagellar biosynthetic protein FliR